jgi:hypothetical protein
MEEYVPLGVREGAIDPSVLYEGVPPWLRQSLKEWVEEALTFRSPAAGRVVSAEHLRTIERICHLQFVWANKQYSAMGSLKLLAENEQLQTQFMWAVDYLCATGSQAASRDHLERVLKEGDSAWRVSTVGVPHLERRVLEAVSEAAEAVISGSGEAGKVLGEAWRDLYGMNPDPSEAYRHAIRAIETAAHATVIPESDTATLGTMIKAMRDKPGKWVATTEGDHPVETIIDMMETVWTGQTDRHGAKGGVRTLVDGAAELAVQLAVALVGLFAGGAVKRSS